MLKEFKQFAMQGNVIDLAVGIIIGGAFGKIITSLVNDIMPPIGVLMGNVDFSNLFINLSGQPVASVVEAEKAGVPLIKYGVFINTLLDFVIVAFAIFFLIKQINRLKQQPEAQPPPPPSTKECAYCCSPIPMKATRCPQCTSELRAA